MRIKSSIAIRVTLLISFMVSATVVSGRLQADTGSCGGATVTLPFTDVTSSPFFCQIAEAYFSGLSNGTTATTYSPAANVTREQMAAFITRAMDQSVKRGSKRAALEQFWTNPGESSLALTSVGVGARLSKSDGADVWVANPVSSTVSRVRASDGRKLEEWTADNAYGVVVALGKIFVTGNTTPGKLFEIDPTQPAGAATNVSSSLGDAAQCIAFDGQRLWTTNGSSVSIVLLNPLSVTNVTAGFTHPWGIVYDGTNIWMTDQGDHTVKKLDSSGNILLSIIVGLGPAFPTFDGTNIWVPTGSNSISVIRATGGLAGTIMTTLTGNGLNGPAQAAFDGERILVTNTNGQSVSLWKASDLTPIGTFSTGSSTFPVGVCSDGVNFWVTLFLTGNVARF